jgi:hypothetical protein
VTLPKLVFMAQQDDPKEAAERNATTRTIRAGRDAWEEISRAESFESWKLIGGALAVGKQHALKVTGANAAWGRNCSRAFSEWMKQHGFDKIAKSVRSVAIESHENANAIEAWRGDTTGTPTQAACSSVIECPPLASRYSAWQCQMSARLETRSRRRVASVR